MLPFNPSSRGLQDFANSLGWGESQKRFSQVGRYGCLFSNHMFWCDGGFVQITNPKGFKKRCQLANSLGLRYDINSKQLSHNIDKRSCVSTTF